MALKRVNLNLEEELVAKVDAYADSMYVNRTNAFALIIGQFFEQKETLKTLSVFASLYEQQKAEDAATVGSN